MKKIIILFIIMLLVLPNLCCAESDITLTWSVDPNANIDGYKVYRSQDPNGFDFKNPTLVVTDPNTKIATEYKIPDGICFWVVRSFKNHTANPTLPPVYLESESSNMVKADLKTLLPYVPSVTIHKILKIDIVEP